MSNKPTNLIDLRKVRDHQNALIIAAFLESRPKINQQTSTFLKQSLKLAGRLDLDNKTLLTKKIRLKHHERMLAEMMRIKAKAEKKLNGSEIQKEDHLRRRLKFITLLHAVEDLDTPRVMEEVIRFKSMFKHVCEQFSQLKCIGSIEVEVVNIELMEQASKKTDSAVRKLSVNKRMMPIHCQGNETVSLIHYHGILDFGKDQPEKACTQFTHLLKSEPQWSRSPYQILIKGLTKEFGGKVKPIESSLHDLSRYFTKGGNIIYGNDVYLKYKVDFDQTDLGYEIAMHSEANRSRKGNLSQIDVEEKENGIENLTSLTHREVVFLADTIDQMMRLNKRKDGYIIRN